MNRRLYLRALADAVATPLTAASPLAQQQRRLLAGWSVGRVLFGNRHRRHAEEGGDEWRGGVHAVCHRGAIRRQLGRKRHRVRGAAGRHESVRETAASLSCSSRRRDGEAVYGPQVLPDGRSVLFTVAATTAGTDRWDKGRIVVQSLASGERKTLIDGGGSDARYVPTGHLVYALSGVLFAVPFDATTTCCSRARRRRFSRVCCARAA